MESAYLYNRYKDFKKHDYATGLRKLIKEQYENLPLDERLALQVLAVYDKPVKPVAIQFILPAMNVEHKLDALAFDYFLAQEHNDYFELHPTVQEYAYEQIPDDEKERLHARAADFYAQLKKPKDEWKTIQDLQPHLDEFDQRVKARQYHRAARLLNTIDFNYLQLWGHSKLVIELREGLIDKLTDKMFNTQKVPIIHIPVRPNEDYDILIGELLIRFNELIKNNK